jgi:hypothetical protein
MYINKIEGFNGSLILYFAKGLKMKKTVLILLVCGGFAVFGQSVSDFRYYTENGGITITGYTGSTRNVKIPEIIDGLPVVAIGDHAFQKKGLTSVVFSNSLISIGDYAFYGNQLTSITLPNSLTSIGDGAFNNNKLTGITLPNSLTSIGDYAFSRNQITGVVIPNSVKELSSTAFDSSQPGLFLCE